MPDHAVASTAFERVTHLGIGAHPDDLEFMALHGILECYGAADKWFGGVTCTDGRGSVRDGELSADALVARRHAEQEEAARIGEYSFIAQLGYSSAEAKDERDIRLTDDLHRILAAAQPKFVYTHNPADAHETHVAVMARVVDAIRRLPMDNRPARVLGCEMWRDLDWLNIEDKVVLDVSSHPELSEKLTGLFNSQSEGGKRYDRAVLARAESHATFLSSHNADRARAVWFAMDLTPLVVNEKMSLSQCVNGHISRFKKSVMDQLQRWEA